jgi:uncharacterized protein YxeA
VILSKKASHKAELERTGTHAKEEKNAIKGKEHTQHVIIFNYECQLSFKENTKMTQVAYHAFAIDWHTKHIILEHGVDGILAALS